MEQTIRDWEMRLRAERKSEVTITKYLWNIRRLAKAYPGKAALDYKRRDLDQYLAERGLMGWSNATTRQAVATFRTFFGYVCGKKSPARVLPFPPKKAKRRTRSLSAQQTGDLLAMFTTLTAIGQRDLALMALLVDTGLRAAEVLRLQLGDLDMPARSFAVMGKGGRERRGKFSVPTGDYLALWLGTRGALAKPGVKAVFLSVGGGRRGQALGVRGLRHICERIAKRLGLPALSPHDLRRTFAHLALRNGSPTRVLQVAGGWEQIRQVETYSREINLGDFDAYSPVGRLEE